MTFRLNLVILGISWHTFQFGDRIQDIERLVGALADIKRLYSRDGKDLIAGEYIHQSWSYLLRKPFIQREEA